MSTPPTLRWEYGTLLKHRGLLVDCILSTINSLQCFDTVGWKAEKVFGV